MPLHSHKLISELQHTLARCDPAASKQRNPLLIRVETKAGHGAGKPTAKVPAFVIFRGGISCLLMLLMFLAAVPPPLLLAPRRSF